MIPFHARLEDLKGTIFPGGRIYVFFSKTAFF